MRRSIVETLRDPEVQRYSLHCDKCGSELYHSNEGVSQGIDTDSSMMLMSTLSHKDTTQHSNYTLCCYSMSNNKSRNVFSQENLTLVKETIDVEITVDIC